MAVIGKHTLGIFFEYFNTSKININNKILTAIHDISYYLTNINDCLTRMDNHLTKIKNSQLEIVLAADRWFTTIKKHLTKIVQTINNYSDTIQKTFDMANRYLIAMEVCFHTIDHNFDFIGQYFSFLNNYFTMLNNNLNTVDLHISSKYAEVPQQEKGFPSVPPVNPGD